VTFDTSMNQNSYSLIGGLELRPKGGDSDTRLGLFGGYIGSNVSFVSYGGAANYSGGTVGGYAAWIQGPMYIDGEVKADFLSVHYTSPSVDFTTGVTSVGVLANAGYRMENGNAFLEPIASFAYVNTGLGNLSGPPTITYSNGQSIRAGIGARVGATMGNPGETQTEIDLLGKVWNEFGGPNTVTFDDGVNPPESFTDGISGIFGEVVGRATIYNADRSASGFVSVGGRFGSNFTTIQAKAGVRKTF
jgi:outer membrane autotransporter protein